MATRSPAIIRWIVVAASLGTALWRGTRAVHWYSEWRRWRTLDPSAAGFYLLNIKLEGSVTLVALTVAAVGLWLVRRKNRAGGRTAA
jgi:hypothetical protein